MIKAIFFDLDDTLLWDQKSIKEAFVRTCEFAKTKYEVSVEALEEAVRNEARNLYASYEIYPFTQMIGINPFEGLWGNFLDDCDKNFLKMKEIMPGYRKDAWTRGLKKLGINDKVFGKELASRFQLERNRKQFIYEDTFQVLNQLKGNYQLLLLTNGSPDLQYTKLAITPELASYFDHIVISGAFGKGKPHPSIFKHALSLLSLQKDEVLMVGDNLLTDILGANRAGIKSVWINRHHKAHNNEAIPTYEIKHLTEIFPIIEEINKE